MSTNRIRSLKAKQAIGPFAYDRQYLVHVRIGQFITAKVIPGNALLSECCGVVTIYKFSDVLAIYDYPTLGRTKIKA